MKYLVTNFYLLFIVSAYSQVIDQNKTAVSSDLFGKATFCLETKNYQQAKHYFGEAIAHFRGNPDYFYGLGLAHYYLGELDPAFQHIKQAIEMDGVQANYFYYAGAILYEKKEYERAKIRYENAVLLNDRSDIKIDVQNSRFHIGVCLMKLNQHQEAINTFSAILEEDPSNHKALLNRGISLAMENKLDRACTDFTRSARHGNDRAKSFLEKYCYGSRTVVVKN